MKAKNLIKEGSWLLESCEGVKIKIWAQPSGSRSEIKGLYNGFLKVKIAAPPVEGAANEQIVRFMSEQLSLKIKQVTLLAGLTSRQKVILVEGLSGDEVRSRLGFKL